MDKQNPNECERTLRRTISRSKGKLAGLLIYAGEPTETVLKRVAGNIGKSIPDFSGKINAADFIHNAASKICECDCFCSCSCDCQCNCDCVCYCDCNCPCLCQSSCDDALALQDIRDIYREIGKLHAEIEVRYGDISDIVETLKSSKGDENK